MKKGLYGLSMDGVSSTQTIADKLGSQKIRLGNDKILALLKKEVNHGPLHPHKETDAVIASLKVIHPELDAKSFEKE